MAFAGFYTHILCTRVLFRHCTQIEYARLRIHRSASLPLRSLARTLDFRYVLSVCVLRLQCAISWMPCGCVTMRMLCAYSCICVCAFSESARTPIFIPVEMEHFQWKLLRHFILHVHIEMDLHHITKSKAINFEIFFNRFVSKRN